MSRYDDIEADDYYDMAVAWIRNRNLDKAISCLKRTIDLNSRFVYAYITLARIMAFRKNYSEAVQVLKRALKIDPEFHRLNFLIAKYACKGGDYKTALAHIERALDIVEKPLYILANEIIFEYAKGKRKVPYPYPVSLPKLER